MHKHKINHMQLNRQGETQIYFVHMPNKNVFKL